MAKWHRNPLGPWDRLVCQFEFVQLGELGWMYEEDALPERVLGARGEGREGKYACLRAV